MTQNFSDQIAFFQLSGDNRPAFKSIARTIRRVGPAALGRFYARVRKTPAAARYFPNEQIMEHAKDKQLQHWLSLFSGSLDSAYIERARTIGVVHARIGLEPSLYFGAYAQVLGELIEVMTKRTWYGWLPGVRSNARRNATLVRAALFDMDIAMTTVFDSALGQVSEAANSVRTGAGEIASASDDHTLRLWDASTGEPLLVFDTKDGGEAVALANDRLLFGDGPVLHSMPYDLSILTADPRGLFESAQRSVGLTLNGVVMTTGSAR